MSNQEAGDYEQWRQACKVKLQYVVAESSVKPNVFHLCVPHNYPLRAAGNLCGGRFEYAGPRDLTAAIALWWLTGHRSGDVPHFDLCDARVAMGELFDETVLAELKKGK